MSVDTLTAADIIRDVAADIQPEDSKLEYTQDMLEYRKVIEDDWAEARKRFPNARLEVPADIDGL